MNKTCNTCIHYSICTVREDFQRVFNKYSPILKEYAYKDLLETIGGNCIKYSVSA